MINIIIPYLSLFHFPSARALPCREVGNEIECPGDEININTGVPIPSGGGIPIGPILMPSSLRYNLWK